MYASIVRPEPARNRGVGLYNLPSCHRGAQVSAKHDRTFRDSFMLVLGILLAVTLVLLGLARAISSRSFQAHRQDDPVYQRELLARIEPLAKVAVAGQDNSALEPAALNVRPAGKLSVTVTPLASDGPLFVTSML